MVSARTKGGRKATEKQARLLRILSGGYVVLAPYRSEWIPLVRRGWVESSTDEVIYDEPGLGRYLPPLRITSDGVRALADAMDAGVLEPASLKPKEAANAS